MPKQVLSTSQIQDYIDQNTLPLDLVASWETLCEVYDALRFTDELTDSMRLEEYKWIIHQMNTFLKNIRKQLINKQDYEVILMELENKMATPDTKFSEGRKSLVYQKLRQRWIINTRRQLMEMIQHNEMEESNGWGSYGTD